MKDAHYNLVKLLLTKLDDIWRVEKHYVRDAAATDCTRCEKLLEKILASDRKNVEHLKKELARHKKRSQLE